MSKNLWQLGRSMPWWALLVWGALCTVLGASLLVRPFHSLVLLSWLITASVFVVGLSRVTASAALAQPWRSRSVGLGWMGAAVLSALWPGLTMHALTVIIGALLCLSAASHLWSAWNGHEERLLVALRGGANLLFGLLVLSAPAATVLVLAFLFGAYVVIFGVRQIVRALALRRLPAEPGTGAPQREPQPWPRSWRLAGTIGALLVALLGTGMSIRIHSAQPAAPGAFYRPPAPLPEGESGTLIRSEIIEAYHPGAVVHRVLYKSTGFDGRPVAVSGLVLVPTSPAQAGTSKILAWTHGTVGVAPNCSPSLLPGSRYTKALPALDAFLEAGYIITATDYQGLGTAGPHPYLVGRSEGMNALDSVRAARNLVGTEAGSEFVVWGESQGGHTALFTGQMAAGYAPELTLRGVVATAPASDLHTIFGNKIAAPDPVGNLLVSMAVSAWSQVYPEATLDGIVLPAARSLVAGIARNCIQNPSQIQASIPAATLLNLIFFRGSVLDTEPWRGYLAENTPGAERTDAPMLIAQGDADAIIPLSAQTRFVESLCAAGDDVDYRIYPDIGHLEISHAVADEVIGWIAERFADEPAVSTCP